MSPKYIRFVINEPNPNSHRREGLFQAAFCLRDRRVLGPDELQHLTAILSWFSLHLDAPTRFARSRRPSAHPAAICWFKPTAQPHIRHMRQIAQLLSDNSMPVIALTTARPGYIVYEDPHQIAAIPFRDTPT